MPMCMEPHPMRMWGRPTSTWRRGQDASQDNPLPIERVNMKRGNLLLAMAMVVSATVMWAGQAEAAVIMDNTSDGVGPELNVDFDLSTAGIQNSGATGNDFDSNGDSSTEKPIFLAPDEIEVTFNLNPGEFVKTFAVSGVSSVNDPSGTNVILVGEDTSGNPLTVTNSFGPGNYAVNSFTEGFGKVTSARVNSFEASVDQFDYEIVPEPASAALLGLAGVALLGRRRS